RLVAAAGENVAAAFPHHPRPKPRIMELVYQRCDNLAVLGFACAEQRASNRLAQREVLDALRGPVGGNLVTGNAPDFFRVGFEENPIETVAESVRHPLF